MARAARPLFIALYTDEDVTGDLAPALRRRGYAAQSAIDAGASSLFPSGCSWYGLVRIQKGQRLLEV